MGHDFLLHLAERVEFEAGVKVFDCFGVDRVMFGSDLPVRLLEGGYAEVMNAVRAIPGPQLDIAGTDRLFGANAARFYGLGDRR